MAYEIAGSAALSVASRNPARQWVGGAAGSSAKDRFDTGEYFAIRHQPKFKIRRDMRIFTMGSCFAREVENVLIQSGMPLVTKDFGIAPELFDSWDEAKGTGGGVPKGRLSRGAFNKYTVASMTHEIRRVLLDEQHEDDGLIELQSDLWFDPHAAGTRSGPYEMVRDCRRQIAAATAQIRQADVVFLTLGLVEGWVDTKTGLAMNRAPGGRPMMRLADRFNFVVPSYGEALVELEETIALIREVCNPDMHFVITVSPVPFHATFRPLDVVTANTLSKSLLRTLTDEVSSRHDFVDYFPSYEIVTNSPRELAWSEDKLHVNHRMVGHVMRSFRACYLDEDADGAAPATRGVAVPAAAGAH